jgi:hypothetical protein
VCVCADTFASIILSKEVLSFRRKALSESL